MNERECGKHLCAIIRSICVFLPWCRSGDFITQQILWLKVWSFRVVGRLLKTLHTCVFGYFGWSDLCSGGGGATWGVAWGYQTHYKIGKGGNCPARTCATKLPDISMINAHFVNAQPVLSKHPVCQHRMNEEEFLPTGYLDPQHTLFSLTNYTHTRSIWTRLQYCKYYLLVSATVTFSCTPGHFSFKYG